MPRSILAMLRKVRNLTTNSLRKHLAETLIGSHASDYEDVVLVPIILIVTKDGTGRTAHAVLCCQFWY